ncbi:MAG: class I SAM-dependent methyltransferase [Candidatus Aminicenantes bacterium]|nr:class I SAM-dependent methyltransferase [Candidatus Aminicenantes bacterium]
MLWRRRGIQKECIPYGKDFAFIYNEKWGDFEENTTPFLLKTVKKEYPGAKTWLDLCCGTGFLLRRIYRRSFIGVGVDRSPYQIGFARINAPQSCLINADIRYLAFRKPFDIISCMFDSLNYITRKAELERLFKNVRSWMHDQSIFFFDMNTYEGLEDRWNSTKTIENQKYTLIMENTFEKKSGRATCRMTGFFKEKDSYRKFGEKHVERGYKTSEIEYALDKSDFVFCKRDGETLEKPEERPPRLLYICRPGYMSTLNNPLNAKANIMDRTK